MRRPPSSDRAPLVPNRRRRGSTAITVPLRLALVLGVSACATHRLVAPEEWTARGANTYRAEIETTDRGSGITTFFGGSSGDLGGAYSFTVGRGAVVGALSECQVAGEREVQ